MRVFSSLKYLLCGACAGFLMPGAMAQETHRFDEQTLSTVHALSATALESDLAYELTRSLTTEIGPRLAATEQEARARDWAVAKLKALGFENVRVESFDMDLWTRGASVFEIASALPHEPES